MIVLRIQFLKESLLIFAILLSVYAVTLYGANSTAEAKLSASTNSDLDSDFNGDGFDDLAIGVPGEDIGTAVDGGAVNVLYGSSSRLQTSSPVDQFWHQGKPSVKDAEEAGDFFGSSLGPGDFNGDGYDDLAIGVSGEDPGGAVNVLYGSPVGLRASASGNTPDDQFWNQNSPGVDNTAESDDGFGGPLTAGDFNGDGFDDLAIGVPGEGIGAENGAGAANVLYGSSAGLRTSAAGDGSGRSDQFWHQGKPGVEDVEEAGDRFASALATGDFNDDGFDDLAIGIPDETLPIPEGGPDFNGALSVLYGTSSGLQADSPDDFLQGGPDELANYGSALATGDFDDDGFDDLAVSAPGYLNGRGDATAIFGCSAGFGACGSDQVDLGAGEEDSFWGGVLDSGDFNGDGFDDVAVGYTSFDNDNEDFLFQGAVEIRYFSSSGVLNSQFWTQDSPGVNDEVEDFEAFGKSLASGDFNDDGSADLAVGVSEDIGTADGAGAVNVLYGSTTNGLQTLSPRDQFWHQNREGVENNAETGDGFGTLP